MNLDHVATPAKAWALILPAFFFFSLLDATAKYVVLSGLAPLFAVWCRFVGHAAFSVIALRVWRDPSVLRTKHPYQQILRGLILTFGTLTNFMALRHLQLAETLALFLAGPMVITALSGPLLNEWAGWRRWLAILIGFVGVLVIVRPGTSMFQWPILWSVASLTMASLYFITTRKLTGTETDESMIVYSALVPTLLLLPVPFIQGEVPGSMTIFFLLCLMGIFGAVGHLFVIKAHRIAPAPLIAPAVFSSIIWMVAFGYLIFDQLPDGWTIAGMAIIALSAFYILRRERFLKQQIAQVAINA